MSNLSFNCQEWSLL